MSTYFVIFTVFLLTMYIYMYIGLFLIRLALWTVGLEKVVRVIVPNKYLPLRDEDIDVEIPQFISIIIVWPVWFPLLILTFIKQLIKGIFKKVKEKNEK